MYGLSDRLKPLSAAEEQVLLAVWDCPAPATRRDISEKLTATGWAPATVLNFLYRLEEKGWVKGGKAGSQNTYLPTVTRRAYCVAAMRQRMDTLFGGSLPEAVRALASESGASKASWNRPSGCWRSSIRRQKNTTCTIPMGNGKTKKLPLRELFRCIRSKDVLKSNAKRYCT